MERIDDWASTTGSLGGIRDKHRGITYTRRTRLPRNTLDALYEQNALVARAVDLEADDAFREGWELVDVVTSDGSQPDLDHVYARCDELLVDAALMQARKWSKLYGGSLVVLPVHDKRPPDTPARPEGGLLFPLRVVPAEDALPLTTDADFSSPTYLETLDYLVSGIASDSVRVHHSRVIPFEAISLPPRTLLENNRDGWGPSIIERLYDELGRDGAAASHAVSMMYVSSILWMATDGFKLEYQTKGGPEAISKRLAAMRRNLDAFGVLNLDAKDTIGSLSLSVTGAHELIDRMRDRLASVAEQPKEILFNESPAGLNAGELSGPQEIWFAKVAAAQKRIFAPALDRILEVLFAAEGIPIVSWRIKWRPLWTRSETAEADRRLKQAQADAIYATQIAAVSSDEVRQARFIDGTVNEIEVKPEAEAPPLDLSGAIIPAEVEAELPLVAETAMNGAQIASMMGIVEKVVAGLIPRDAAIGVIGAAFPTLRGQEDRILGSAGIGVAPAALAAPAAPEEPSVEAVTESTEPPPADLISPRDAAAQYGVPTRTITRAIERGDLPYWGLGAHRRVSAEAVAQLATRHTRDRVEQRGEVWVVLSAAGEVLGEHATQDEAQEQLDGLAA